MITDEYKVWKAETLARQTEHMEINKDVPKVENKIKSLRNDYEIVLAPGYR